MQNPFGSLYPRSLYVYSIIFSDSMLFALSLASSINEQKDLTAKTWSEKSEILREMNKKKRTLSNLQFALKKLGW
jgi:hypothetical protein